MGTGPRTGFEEGSGRSPKGANMTGTLIGSAFYPFARLWLGYHALVSGYFDMILTPIITGRSRPSSIILQFTLGRTFFFRQASMSGGLPLQLCTCLRKGCCISREALMPCDCPMKSFTEASFFVTLEIGILAFL